MFFLSKRRKGDLYKLAIELGVREISEMEMIEIKTIITMSESYEEDSDFVKGLLEMFISSRLEEERKQKE
ncbi:hypothetical protein CEXT_486601 [Caerostris extrusa]|uniref:Uncharacterized protein n=1 Tax=Caerostris extrusa TaxID=172846 RepID=A0AAV4STF5_CAEEX|nr:hypothetical protein CEXT_486601 [Caerostris extrusa]